MELVNPGIGLIFWMTLIFSIVLFLLKKFAWKPIMQALKEREDSIDNALSTAEKAREEIKELRAGNENLLNEAKEEKILILKEAKKIKDSIIEEAKTKASEEANNIVESAKKIIENEKKSAIIDLKKQLASLSIEVAEKLLKKELSEDDKQKELMKKLIDEANFN